MVRKHQEKKELLSDKETLIKLSNKDEQDGKGTIGNWSDNQKNLIIYIIAESLIDTQYKLSHKKMENKDFVKTIHTCLECIAKNFSEKYSFSYVMERIENSGKDKDFDEWFRNLYTTCDCNDSLGKLLAKLLKEFWIEKSSIKCQEHKDKIIDCISKIKMADFSQGMVDYLYKNIEDCVSQYCPAILSDKEKEK